jgi:hypothetical protein
MFRDLECELRMTGGIKSLSKFRRSENYRAVGDLRPFEVPAIAHLAYSRKGEENHKLELVNTGEMGYSEMLDAVERVFEIDPRKAEVMRVDLCADVRGVPVTWFKQHCRPQYKRFGAEYEDCKAVSMGRCGIETFNYGKHPNFYRIYNKIAQWKHEYTKRLRAAKREVKQIEAVHIRAVQRELKQITETPGWKPIERTYEFPEIGAILTKVEHIQALQCELKQIAETPGWKPIDAIPAVALKPFDEMYGYPETGVTLTRVERQIGGGGPRIPEQVSRVGKLIAVADYNPYERLEIMSGGLPEPSKDAYPIDTYMAGMYLRNRIREEGLLFVRTWLNGATNGHGARTLETYKDFMPPCESAVTREQIYELYRCSVSRQLAA